MPTELGQVSKSILELTLLIIVDKSANTLSNAGSNKNLEALAKRLGVDESVTKNPYQQGKVPRTTLASTVEALIGAVWADSGNNFAQVQAVIRALGVTEPFEGSSAVS
jgi:dsRNA-specific ribonuclease